MARTVICLPLTIPVHIGFVVNRVSAVLVFIQVILLFPVSIISPVLHTRLVIHP